MYSYNGFKAGELIIYTDGETYEIGRIKGNPFPQVRKKMRQ